MKANIGLIGVGVMGENLIMNIESRGYTVSCYDVLLDKTRAFVEGRGKDKNIIGTYSLEEFVNSLEKPRKVMLMIKAGAPVDSVIESLIPLLDKGDILYSSDDFFKEHMPFYFSFVPDNTTIVIENGQVTAMKRIYTP